MSCASATWLADLKIACTGFSIKVDECTYRDYKYMFFLMKFKINDHILQLLKYLACIADEEMFLPRLISYFSVKVLYYSAVL